MSGGGPEPAARQAVTILAVAEVGRAAAFYRHLLGWAPRVEVPVYVELAPPAGPGLGLYQRTAFAVNTGEAPELPPPGRLSGTELYFHVDDLPAALARAAEVGARLLAPLAPRGWGDEAAYFADPDGNVVVLARPRDAV